MPQTLLKNDLLLKALSCSNTGRPPVWLMRQAGRYMPEYRALRAKYSFLEMCHNPELVLEITKLPLDAFGMDAAILFSDILVIPEALGLGLRFEDQIGPILERPLRTPADIDALPQINVYNDLSYVEQAIRLMKPELDVPLLGFAGAPFTVASYMIEGGSSKALKATKQWMLRDPISFHRLLNKIADDTIAYLEMQIKAGVDAVQLFDSWAHVLGHVQFREFSLAYMKRIVDSLQHLNTPIILYCRGSSVFANQLAEANPAAISLDWNADITQMRPAISSKIALQGNIDPDLLYAPHHVVRKEVQRLVNGMRGDKGFVLNLGHGIHPDTPVDAVRSLIDCVKESG
jgi:uroporphyrinogen decarboxylase